MVLTDAWLRAAKPAEKVVRKADGGGLSIEIAVSGSKLWRLFYRFNGKQKILALGSYPLIGLAKAREQRDEAKKLLLKGIDPMEARKAKAATAENTFESAAREWHEWKAKGLSRRYARQIMDRLEADVFPEIGAREIDQIDPPDVLAMLRKIENRGALEMAKRIKEHCSQIFRFAIVQPSAKTKRDPCADLRGALRPSPPVKHHRVVRFNELPQLLRDIDGYHHIGEEMTRIGLQLAVLTIVRTSELIEGEWSQIEALDADQQMWVIPDKQMKMQGRDGHIVPLSRQAVACLRELWTR